METLSQSSTDAGKPFSFVQELFLGRFLEKSIFPFYEQDESESARGDKRVTDVADFSQTISAPGCCGEASLHVGESLKRLGKRGFLGMTVPKDFGGGNDTFFNLTRVVQQLGGRCASTACALGGHAAVVDMVAKFGSESQKDRWLKPLVDGEISAAVAFAEPETTVANQSNRCVVRPTDAGGYELRGEEGSISSVPDPELILVCAADPNSSSASNENAVTVFLIETQRAGVTVASTQTEKTSQIRMPAGAIAFENVVLEKCDILGTAGGGNEIRERLEQRTGIAYAAASLGAGRKLLSQMVERVKAHKQSGLGLAQSELARCKIANASSKLFALQCGIEHAAAHIDIGGEDVQNEALMLQWSAHQIVREIMNDAMDLDRTDGEVSDSSLACMLQEARFGVVSAGGGDFLGQRIAKNAIKLISEDLKTLATQWWKAPSKIYVGAPSIEVKHEHLRFHARWMGSQFAKLAWSLKSSYATHGQDILKQQLQCQRLASIGTSLFLSSCVYSKLTATLVNGTIAEPEQRAQFATGNLFLQTTRDHNDQRFESLKINHDELINHAADVCFAEN